MEHDPDTRHDGLAPWARRGVTVVFDDTEGGLLPVAEVLLQVAALAPGPEAITMLHGLVGRPMDYTEQLRVIELWQPQKAWLEGAEQDLLLDYAGPTPDPADKQAVLADEFNPGPLARVLGSTANHAFDRVFTARKLAAEFRDLGDLLRAGQLDPYRVHIILETLLTFPTLDHALAVQEQILPDAAGLSPTKLRKTLRRLAREVDPDWNTQMFTQARKARRVVFDDTAHDGLVGMHAYLPPVEALAMEQHLNKAAKTGPLDESDRRGHDERMADALVGAVLGTTPGDPSTPMSPQVLVNVFVPLPTLLALRAALPTDTDAEADTDGEATVDTEADTDTDGEAITDTDTDGEAIVDTDTDTGNEAVAERMIEIEGLGPVPAGLLRQLGQDVSWRRWVLEPVTGHLQDLGHRRYRPDAALDEYARARDRYCRYPNCHRRAIRCDLDHLCAWCKAHPDQGGRTSAANLATECRRHHRGKTLGILTVTGDANNTLTWTDQHGHTNTTQPHNYNNGL